jgi:citrate synthase
MPAAMSRLTARSKTFLTQACGASILAFGHAYGAYDAIGKRLVTALEKVHAGEITMDAAAANYVREFHDDEAFGVSDLMLKDPAAKRLLARAAKLGVAGEHVALMEKIVEEAQKASASPVDIDLLGAIAPVMGDLGFTPEATWTLIAVTRSIGTGAHFIEEVEREGYTRLGETLTPKDMYDGPEDRPVPPFAEGKQQARLAQTHTLEEWKAEFERRKELNGSGFGIEEKIEDPSKTSH